MNRGGTQNADARPCRSQGHFGRGTQTQLRLCTRVTNLIDARLLEPVLQMERQTAGIPHRMPCNANRAAVETGRDFPRHAWNDFGKPYTVSAYLQFVTTKVAGLDGD